MQEYIYIFYRHNIVCCEQNGEHKSITIAVA